MTVGLDDSAAWLKAHADDPLVKRAYLLAQGLGSLEDKRDHLQSLPPWKRGTSSAWPRASPPPCLMTRGGGYPQKRCMTLWITRLRAAQKRARRKRLLRG